MKKIAIITATRAEYGLLYPLIKEIIADSFFDCHVIVTGTHLLNKYGNTIKFIENDCIPISYKVSIMEESHTDYYMIISNALIEFSKIFSYEKYDAIVLLGDRYELYGFAIPAMLQNIPIIHIHGGEKTEGAIDEKIRHSITKMSSIHFTSTEEYRKRVIQMGESPSRVFNVGALGIDNIMHLDLIDVCDLSKELGVDFKNKKVAIVTYHPETITGALSERKQIEIVLEALIKTEFISIVTMPNSDAGGDAIMEIISDYSKKYQEKFVFFKSLGQKRYLSALNYASLVVGNSSSGIIETASFGVPTINIGDRQKGRISPKNVIHCKCDEKEIIQSINIADSKNFRDKIKGYSNPYGDGNAAIKIVDILKKISWESENLVKKQFYDINYEK